MRTRIAVLLAGSAWLGWCGDWNPKLAADYLDSRQKAWLEWPVAVKNGAACISCHTNLVYLLARPSLRRTLHEAAPATYEGRLLDNLRKDLSRRTPADSQAVGTESILAALLLAQDGSREQAFHRMWALQIGSGKDKGAWHWFNTGLDPWEEPDSVYFGATLAAVAVGAMPAEYRVRPDVRANVDALKAYLLQQRAEQPLHNRLLLLWAGNRWRDLLTDKDRTEIEREGVAKQRDDGGWSIESLGPWTTHPNAPPSDGANAYATAVAAFALQQGGVGKTDPAVKRALEWLRRHQEREGYWDAVSMNKRYEAGSMQSQFMRDAATGFAVLALAAQ